MTAIQEVTTTVFRSGNSQAVRIPAAFTLDVDRVYIHQDAHTGDITLSTRPQGWQDFFGTLDGLEIPDDFLDPHDRSEAFPQRDPFGGIE